jgi:signal transduction histidine kinase
MGLKYRFTFFFTSLFALLLGGFSVTVYFQVKKNVMASADSALISHLEHEARHLGSPHEPYHAHHHPPHVKNLYQRVWKDGELVDDSFPEDVDIQPGTTVPQEAKLVREVRANRGKDHFLLLGYYDLTSTLDYLAALRRTLWLAAILAVLVVVPLGLFSTKILLAPFARLAGQASMLNARRLSFRFPEGKHADEYGVLVTSFNHLLERLERSFGHLARFAANASHELRTPLAVIIGQAERARRKARDVAEHDVALEKILAQATTLRNIIDRLLFIADLERVDQKSETSDIPVREAIQEVLTSLRFARSGDANQEGRQLEIEIPESLRYHGDPEIFLCVTSNLLENALKYANGRIAVRAAREASGLHLDIEDDGPGIPVPDRERVLEPFTKNVAALPLPPKGHGLGLSIVKACVDTCRGSIALFDSPLGGLQVRIFLPQ